MNLSLNKLNTEFENHFKKKTQNLKNKKHAESVFGNMKVFLFEFFINIKMVISLMLYEIIRAVFEIMNRTR
jgi:hypothetical protein